ncbi:hypothetical protein NHQ30_006429 [Ciborinia camelliae]|nr:hypothetical protein NHQ30_006429 [Ciborinia camelliae]
MSSGQNYPESEKAYLLHLCAIHGITEKKRALDHAHAKVRKGMLAEAPRHHEGGALFDTDPWPVRTYEISAIKRKSARILSESSTDVNLEKMKINFILNDEEKMRIEFILSDE